MTANLKEYSDLLKTTYNDITKKSGIPSNTVFFDTMMKDGVNYITNFDISSLHLKVHHTAKQTSILQNTPLKNNSLAGKLILVAAVFAINSPTDPLASPVK